MTFDQSYISLAGIESFAFVERQFYLDQDIVSLRLDATVQNLRNTYQADLVVLLTDGNYKIGQQYAYGRVADFGPNEAYAYAIVEADRATSTYTFAHEVGHLFGGLHQNSNLEPLYAKGYEFETGWFIFKKDRTTLMYSNPGDYILNYSNPEIEYKDEPTGTLSSNNVAQKLREEAATVEAFRSYVSPLSTYITGPASGDNDGTYSWNSTTANGVPPFTYLWQYSLDGFNYIGTLGITSSITAKLPQNNDLHLKLTVNSSDGQTADAYHTTINMDTDYDPNDPPEPLLRNNGGDTNDIESENENNSPFFMTVYPNPVKDISKINYFVNEKETTIIIKIIDINGRTIKSMKYLNQNRGQYYVTFDSEGLNSGVYFCQISMKKIKSVQKIIIE